MIPECRGRRGRQHTIDVNSSCARLVAGSVTPRSAAGPRDDVEVWRWNLVLEPGSKSPFTTRGPRTSITRVWA